MLDAMAGKSVFPAFALLLFETQTLTCAVFGAAP
jgi:hypothetical protein